MKIYTGKAFILSIVAVNVACGTSLKVMSDYDKNIDFKRYKTFAVDTVRINETLNQLNISRITNAVKADLVKKGFTENISGPDFKVSAAAIVKDKQSMAGNTDYYSEATRYTTYNLQNYKDGSLLVDIADAKTNKLVWEGIGNKQVNKPIKDPDKEIPAMVTSIMAGFPPKEN